MSKDFKNSNGIVWVIDEDVSVRDAVATFLRSHDFDVRTAMSAEEFLAAADFDRRGCLVTEVRLPGMGGGELLEDLKRRRIDWPVILMETGASVRSAVSWMQAGAFDFVEKPFFDRVLLNCVRRALRHRSEQSPSGG